MSALNIREPETLTPAEVRLLRKKLRQLQWQPEELLREASQIARACRIRRVMSGNGRTAES